MVNEIGHPSLERKAIADLMRSNENQVKLAEAMGVHFRWHDI
jgi:hypothetical protein